MLQELCCLRSLLQELFPVVWRMAAGQHGLEHPVGIALAAVGALGLGAPAGRAVPRGPSQGSSRSLYGVAVHGDQVVAGIEPSVRRMSLSCSGSGVPQGTETLRITLITPARAWRVSLVVGSCWLY